MSFDELPPDSEQNRSSEEEVPTTEQEASALDAPPASAPRRRRARSTGTDAASASSSTESKPPRTRRAKPKPADEASEPARGDSADPAELPAVPRPSRRRGTRKASADESPAAEAHPAEPQEAPVPRRARAPRRSRQAETEPQAESRSESTQTGTPALVRISVRPDAEAEGEIDASAPLTEPITESQASEAATAVTHDPTDTPPTSEFLIVTEELAPVDSALSEATAEEFELTEPAARDEPHVELLEAPFIIAEIEGVTVRIEDDEQQDDEQENGDSLFAVGEEEDEEEPGDAGAADVAGVEPTAEIPGLPRPSRNRRNRNDRRNRRDTPPSVEAETSDARSAPVAPVFNIPLPPPLPVRKQIDRTRGAHLLTVNGTARIHINGTAYPPVLFFGNMEGTRNQQRVISEVRRAAKAGVHLHSTIIELPCPLSEATEALDEVDRLLRAILDADPQGYVMPRIVFVPARGWKREYPTDIASYADAVTGDPSLTSERFWREAEHTLETLVSHLGEYEWGARVFGYHLERGEWFQPAELGYDRSMANREAFRDWLREKYKNSLVALRAAWYDGDVQFHTAEIPPFPPKQNAQRAFFEARRERQVIDFYEFTSESTAQRLAGLARALKEAASDQALVSVCYGYTFEFGHGFSGHLALGNLLQSEDIDLVCGPPSYRDRKPGGAASFPAPVDSVLMHGKLWLSEDDSKTFLSPVQQDPDDFNPRLTDRFQTEQAHARAMGRALATGTGIGFMDLWGEGWLDDEGLWDRIGGFAEKFMATIGERTKSRMPEVVAIIDEKSLLHVQRGEPFFRRLTNGLRDLLQRAGISYGTYLQSDLLSSDFPQDAKLYLFLTPYRLTTEQRTAIKEKLQGGNRTLAWLYAPGSCEERSLVAGVMEESATGTVGMTLLQQEWNSEVGSRIIDPRHPVTERLNGREIGVKERMNPSFYIEDPDAVVLAEYQGSGLPSIAVKKCGNWQSVFVGEPVLTLDLLRGICKYAGVHLWTGGGDDVTFVGSGWVTVHANRDGHRALRLPEPVALYDATEMRLVGEDVREHRFFLRAGTTKTFCVGSIDRFQRLGFTNLMAPQIVREARPVQSQIILPPPPPLPSTAAKKEVKETREVREIPANLSEDMQTLQAVLSMDLSEIDDLSLDDAEGYEEDDTDELDLRDPDDAQARLAALLPDAEIVPGGRRRRRRGGRGRGRRRPDEVLEGSPVSGAEISGAAPAENRTEAADGTGDSAREAAHVSQGVDLDDDVRIAEDTSEISLALEPGDSNADVVTASDSITEVTESVQAGPSDVSGSVETPAELPQPVVSDHALLDSSTSPGSEEPIIAIAPENGEETGADTHPGEETSDQSAHATSDGESVSEESISESAHGGEEGSSAQEGD